ncbi:MAG: hypothetical protein IJO48_06510 [Clostridia bacterium]|nr:hypothetical protein [Clostridia bacterium]
MSDIQEMQIYGIIAKIEDALEESPRPKIGGGQGNRRLVDIDEIVDLLGDLKVTIPDDIRRANSVIIEAQNRMENADQYASDTRETAEEYARKTVETANAQGEKTVHEAEETAQQIIERAKQEYEKMVSEDEIYREAQKRAQLLAMKAEHSATEVYENAKVYADQILADMERFLDEYRQLVSINRKDLGARSARPATVAEDEQEMVESASEAYADAVAQAPANSGSSRSRKVAVQPLDDDEYDEDYDDDDFDDEDEGSLFSWFKRKNK